MHFWLYKIIKVHVTELILSWKQLIFHISCSSLVDILHEYYWKNTNCTYFSSLYGLYFSGSLHVN